MQAQRTISNTKWFDYKTNIDIRSLTKRQPIQRYIAQGRIRWFCHLLRSLPNDPAHAIYTGLQPDGGGLVKTRGAPRTWWSHVLGKDLKQLGTTLTEASNIALDRTRWRTTFGARAVSTPSGKSLSEVGCVCTELFQLSKTPSDIIIIFDNVEFTIDQIGTSEQQKNCKLLPLYQSSCRWQVSLCVPKG